MGRKRKKKDRSRRMKKDLSCGRNRAELDRDVLMLIFQKMGTLEVLRVAGSLCRSWRKVATEEPELWRKIDKASHDYGFEAFMLTDPTRLAIDRSKGRVQEFYLDFLGDDDLLRYLCDRITNRGLRAILDGCPYLETLDICRCRNVKMDDDMRARYAKLKTIRLPEDSVHDYLYEADNDDDLGYVNF